MIFEILTSFTFVLRENPFLNSVPCQWASEVAKNCNRAKKYQRMVWPSRPLESIYGRFFPNRDKKCTFHKVHSNWLVLRVRAFFHETVRVCHVYCNFKIGFTCRITVIFGTLNGGSLLINTLASNICFSYRNMFQNGVDALSKNSWRLFVKKLKISSSSDYPIMFKFC